jgi:hypothetical protein
MMPQKQKTRSHHKTAEGVVKKEPSEDVEQNFQKKKSTKFCKLLGSDAVKDLDSDEVQVKMKKEQNVSVKMKKEPKTKEKPNLKKLEMEKNSNTKTERQWPKGVRICSGPLPLQRIPTREKHGQANSRNAVEKKVKNVEMKAKKKKKPMHENLYGGSWSDAVRSTGHHISQVEKMAAVAAQFPDDGEFLEETMTVHSPFICRWDQELPRTAFDGWKSLHYGLKQQQLEFMHYHGIKPQSRQ